MVDNAENAVLDNRFGDIESLRGDNSDGNGLYKKAKTTMRSIVGFEKKGQEQPGGDVAGVPSSSSLLPSSVAEGDVAANMPGADRSVLISYPHARSRHLYVVVCMCLAATHRGGVW